MVDKKSTARINKFNAVVNGTTEVSPGKDAPDTACGNADGKLKKFDFIALCEPTVLSGAPLDERARTGDSDADTSLV